MKFCSVEEYNHYYDSAHFLYMPMHIFIVTKVSGLPSGGPFTGLTMNRPKAVSQTTMNNMRKGNCFNLSSLVFAKYKYFHPYQDNTAL